ncbi:MAG: ATP-binding protein [Bacteroidales bacterium]|nr:ATP-binding protein [Bacteroidales bacterium]
MLDNLELIQANELFSLMAKVAKQNDRKAIIATFVEGINSIYPGYGIAWGDVGDNVVFDICTPTKMYGGLKVKGDPIRKDSEVQLIKNAGQILAMAIENLENKSRILNDKQKFDDLIDKQSRNLQDSEDEIRESESTIRAVLDNNKLSFIIIRKNFSIKLYNLVASKLVQAYYQKELATGASIFEYLPADSHEKIRGYIVKAFSGERSEVIFPMLIQNSYKWYSYQFYPVESINSEISLICVTSIDVTELIKSEEALKDSEQNLKTLLDTNLQAFILLGRDCEIKTYNEVANGFFLNNYQKALSIGKIVHEYIPDGVFKDKFVDSVNRAVEGKFVDVEMFNESSTGNRWHRFQFYPAEVEKGKVTTICISSIDITDFKNTEEELLTAKQAAEESDQLKSAFLANMSHEIRTPMNGIIGFSEMIAKPNMSDEKREYYSKIIINSSRQLLGIVNDIMDISRIETGKIEMKQEMVVLNDLVGQLYDSYKTKVQDTNIGLLPVKGLSDFESVIETDKKKLMQVLNNLLNNAVKFTQSGFIKFGYALKDKKLEFFVEDTGIGIPGDLHEKIFERFRQGDVETTRKYGGTGLGLSISQKLVQLLGGEIWLESELDKGSKFFFTLPYSQVTLDVSELPAELEPVELEEDELGIAMTILIAEDEDTNYLYLEEVLSDYNCKLYHAKDGVQAVKLAKEKQDIQLVLMDIKMPNMNGLEATKAIKAFRPDLPVIAQTAFAMESDKQKAFASGCDDYIAKPIVQYNLIETLKKYVK